MDVAEGSITALIGPNGAGKTTFFNLITGFYRPDRGRAMFDGREVQGRPPYVIARLGMVRTFQITKALAAMPVIDNMMLAAPDQPGESLRNVIFRPVAWRRREDEVHEQAMELLDVFNLTRLADDYAGTLSGGQRKLLELARALMARPRFLLLDEPMAGINPTLGRRLLDHMQRLRAEEGVTFLFIEHDMEVVMNHSDRVIVMAEGRVIADGEPHEVRSDQAVIDAYLGGASNGGGAMSEGTPQAKVLETEGVVAGYVPEVDILNGVSINVQEGEIVTIVGPNGAGKSTLIKTIFGLLRRARGGSSSAARTSAVASRTTSPASGSATCPSSTTSSRASRSRRTSRWARSDRSRTKDQKDRMYELFPRLGERRSQAAGTMSGGERQMVAMARALMPDPQVLLLDEPSAGLAPAFVDAIFEKIAGDQPGGRDDRDGRAERPPRARDVRPRLRARPRQGPLRGARARTCSTTRRSPSSTSAARRASTGRKPPPE